MGNRLAHILHVDYSGRPAGSCVCAVSQELDGSVTGTFRLVPTLSSFKGEYLAILLGLRVAYKRRWRSVIICSDSEDAVRAASAKVLAATSPVASYHPTLQDLKSTFALVTMQKIERTANVAHPFSQAAGQAFHVALGHESLDALLRDTLLKFRRRFDMSDYRFEPVRDEQHRKEIEAEVYGDLARALNANGDKEREYMEMMTKMHLGRLDEEEKKRYHEKKNQFQLRVNQLHAVSVSKLQHTMSLVAATTPTTLSVVKDKTEEYQIWLSSGNGERLKIFAETDKDCLAVWLYRFWESDLRLQLRGKGIAMKNDFVCLTFSNTKRQNMLAQDIIETIVANYAKDGKVAIERAEESRDNLDVSYLEVIFEALGPNSFWSANLLGLIARHKVRPLSGKSKYALVDGKYIMVK
jgi:hypothetical protein